MHKDTNELLLMLAAHAADDDDDDDAPTAVHRFEWHRKKQKTIHHLFITSTREWWVGGERDALFHNGCCPPYPGAPYRVVVVALLLSWFLEGRQKIK